MKYLVNLSRLIVGVLFIISGLIKLNDPMGFSFKLEEYFSSGVLDIPFLEPYALALSVVLVIVEVLLGVMLLIGYRPKATVWSLFIMILFFTFLTFYSAYFNKVTDCGCFGDAIKLTPWESFAKDVILLVLIIILMVGKKYIQPIFTGKFNAIVLGITFSFCASFAWYVLNHLPVVDFRPYKIGANIEDGMKIPEDAPKPIYEYTWHFKTPDGDQTIVTNGDYPSVDGEFIDVKTKEIQEGYEPPIHDFTIEKNGEDLALEFLKEPKLLMVIAYDLNKTHIDAFSSIAQTADAAMTKGYKVIGMSASSPEISNRVIQNKDLHFDFCFTDETTLKTIVRSNPGVLLLHKGTIKQKVHYNDLDKLVF